MDRRDRVETEVIKYGAVEVSRHYIRGIRAALANIRNGIETNNFALTAKDVGLLADHLASLEIVYGIKGALDQLSRLDEKQK